MTIEEMWESLILIGVSEETLNVVTCINGCNEETMKDVLHAVTGYRDFNQLLKESGNER